VNREDLHVGMRVWVSSHWGWRRGEVLKIGRLLVVISTVTTASDGTERVEDIRWAGKYRIDTQLENVKDFGGSFKTDEQRKQSEFESGVDAYLSGVGVSFDRWKCAIDFADRVKIMELLKELGY
jgi:hypothetical protein